MLLLLLLLLLQAEVAEARLARAQERCAAEEAWLGEVVAASGEQQIQFEEQVKSLVELGKHVSPLHSL